MTLDMPLDLSDYTDGQDIPEFAVLAGLEIFWRLGGLVSFGFMQRDYVGRAVDIRGRNGQLVVRIELDDQFGSWLEQSYGNPITGIALTLRGKILGREFLPDTGEFEIAQIEVLEMELLRVPLDPRSGAVERELVAPGDLGLPGVVQPAELQDPVRPA